MTKLTVMALNDTKRGCLCHIQAGKSVSYILTVISCNEYLSSDVKRHNDTHRSIDLDVGVLKMINIYERCSEELSGES